MLSIRKAKRQARRGANWLDFTKPDWYLTVDIANFTICSEDRCMGAQLFGNGNYSRSGIGINRWAERHGFMVDGKGNSIVLDRAWIEEVVARRDKFNIDMGTADGIVISEMGEGVESQETSS